MQIPAAEKNALPFVEAFPMPVGARPFVEVPVEAFPMPAGTLPMLSVIAPPRTKANQQFLVYAPNGQQLTVALPPDVQAGVPFNIIVPAHVLLAPPSPWTVPFVQATYLPPQAVPAPPQASALTALEMERHANLIRTLESQQADSVPPRYPPMEDRYCTCIGESSWSRGMREGETGTEMRRGEMWKHGR